MQTRTTFSGNEVVARVRGLNILGTLTPEQWIEQESEQPFDPNARYAGVLLEGGASFAGSVGALVYRVE